LSALIVPDVLVVKQVGPRLQNHAEQRRDVSPRGDIYANALRQHSGQDPALQHWLQEARADHQNIQQRFDTIPVSTAIVERQKLLST
jgi:DNA-directed RNA polymerase specialized sigma54-like protein